MPKLVPFDRLARKLPSASGAQHLHPATIYRWHRHGVLRAGVRVRLRAVKMGGRWCSTWRWVKTFFASVSPVAIDLATPAELQMSQEQVDRELDRLGF